MNDNDKNPLYRLLKAALESANNNCQCPRCVAKRKAGESTDDEPLDVNYLNEAVKETIDSIRGYYNKLVREFNDNPQQSTLIAIGDCLKDTAIKTELLKELTPEILQEYIILMQDLSNLSVRVFKSMIDEIVREGIKT